ncbi:mannosyltransferase, putative [Toxoplasma gondii ME49]|uniref:Mannosyltransferase n=1 Tax=Toxoplasma gondii (strain ATCC 50611 / Me49) TaxID=508771 RepID=S8FBL6_TOXGM|nr:mannosyltransferase, putative [Toxoplasma gondii ME49]EPT32257.1 mannosyltransferase, putative [Toxoplasma gondii ME49]|eukprot:XP_018638410.1 mannosyltransferase, putative [Toxoplasma gondii ME49]
MVSVEGELARERSRNRGDSHSRLHHLSALKKPLATLQVRWILAGLIAFRIVNGLVLNSSFNPDEHWQSSEVAHHLVFGYGFLTWEWEPCIALRSVIHPALFAGLYWLLGRFSLDSPSVIALAPRVMQSIIAGFTDYGTFQLAQVWYPLQGSLPKRGTVRGTTVTEPSFLSFYVLLCCVFSWFQFFCLPRTYSSCIEAALNVWSLVFFGQVSSRVHNRASGTPTCSLDLTPDEAGSFELHGSPYALRNRVRSKVTLLDTGRPTEKNDCSSDGSSNTAKGFTSKVYLMWALLLAALGVLVRPTAAIFWAVFCLFKLAQLCADASCKTPANEGNNGRVSSVQPRCFLGLCVAVGLVAVACCLVCDSLFYGFVTFPPWNFVKFNLFSDPGKFYGEKPWHYFLLEGPGVVLLSFYPFLVVGVCVWWKALRGSLRRSLESTGNDEDKQPAHLRYGFAILRIIKTLMMRDDGATAVATICALVLLSTATHKEYRFMVPFLPQLLIFTGIGVATAIKGRSVVIQQLQASPLLDGDTHHPASKRYRASRLLKLGLGLAFVLQIVAAVFCGFFHQMGASRVVAHLQSLPEAASVFFLTSCHELPFYSHVHRRIPMGFLDCSPRVDDALLPMNWQQRFWTGNKEERIAFLDSLFPRLPTQFPDKRTDKKSSDAYSHVAENSDPRTNSWFGDAKSQQHISTNPAKCLEYRFRVPLEAREMPTHLIFPNALMSDLAEWLAERGYKQAVDPIFDAAFAETPADNVLWQYLLVFERRKSNDQQ